MVRPLGRGAARLIPLVGALLVTSIAGCGGSTPPPAHTRTQPHQIPGKKTTGQTRRFGSSSSTSRKLVACGTQNSPGSEPTSLTGLFSADSVWNRPDIANHPLGDQQLAQELTQEAETEIKQGIGPWIETDDDSTPVYVVGPDQRCVPVHLDVTQAYGRDAEQGIRARSAAGRMLTRQPAPTGT